MEQGAESFHTPERGETRAVLERLADVPDTFDSEVSEYKDLLTKEEAHVRAEDVREIVEEGGALYAVLSRDAETMAYFVVEKSGTHAEVVFALGSPSYELLPEHFEELCRALAERGFGSVSVHTAPEAAHVFHEMMDADGEEDGFVHLTRDL